MRNPPVPPGFWRGVNINQNAIYMECFMDELAHAAGKDPLEFRRRLMANHPKSLAVLNAVAEKAGWGKPAPTACIAAWRSARPSAVMSRPARRSRSMTADSSRFIASSLPPIPATRSTRSRSRPRSKARSCSVCRRLLYGECTINGGRVEQENFDTYPSMLIAEMPKVEVIVMPSGGFWGGVGEPTIAVAAPAVLNAIFAATGKRIRQFPLKNTDLRAA